MAERLTRRLGGGEEGGSSNYTAPDWYSTNPQVNGQNIFGSLGYSGQTDDAPSDYWTISGDPANPYSGMIQIGAYQDGGRRQQVFDELVKSGQARYDPNYGWVANQDAVKETSTALFPSSNLEAALMFAGLVGGGVLGGGLMGGAEALGGGMFPIGAETLGSGVGAGLGEAVTGGLTGGLSGGAGLGELGSGTYGLTGSNGLNTLTGNLLDPAVTGTNVLGETIGTTGATTGAGGSTVVNNVFNPLDPSTWGNAPQTPPTPNLPGDGNTTTPGTNTTGTPTGNNTGTGKGWLDRILSGDGTATDWTRFFGPGAGAVLDYFGDKASGDKATELWNLTMNSPGMTRFNESFAPGWNIMNADPAFQGALDQTAQAATRAYSTKVGNVAGNPGAQGEIGNYIMNSALVPWTNTYRSQNLTAAGLGANIAGTFAAPQINAAGSGFDNAGAFLGSLGKSDNPWEDFMKKNNISFTGNGLA